MKNKTRNLAKVFNLFKHGHKSYRWNLLERGRYTLRKVRGQKRKKRFLIRDGKMATQGNWSIFKELKLTKSQALGSIQRNDDKDYRPSRNVIYL